MDKMKKKTLSFTMWYRQFGQDIQNQYPKCDLEIHYMKHIKKHYNYQYERIMEIRSRECVKLEEMK